MSPRLIRDLATRIRLHEFTRQIKRENSDQPLDTWHSYYFRREETDDIPELNIEIRRHDDFGYGIIITSNHPTPNYSRVSGRPIRHDEDVTTIIAELVDQYMTQIQLDPPDFFFWMPNHSI